MNAKSVWLLSAAALLASAAWSEERTVALRDVTVVQDGHGAARVFFRLAELPFGESTMIEGAVLTIPFDGTPVPRSMELRVSPVTQAWSGIPAFDTPFDADLSGRCEVDLNRHEGVAVIDLTVALKERLEDGVFSDGFVLTAQTEESSVADLARFGSLAGADVHLSTTTLPSGRPPRRG